MLEPKFRTIFLIVLLDLIGIGIIFPLLPFYTKNFNADPFIIGLVLAAYPLMQFIFTPILGHLSDKYGRKPVLIISLLGSFVGYIILALATNIWIVFLARIIDGITGGNITAAQAYISDITNEKERRQAMGLIGMAFGLGFMIGPMIGGLLGSVNPSYPGFFAAFLALLSVLMVHFTLKEKGTNAQHSTPLKAPVYFDVLKDSKLRPFFLVSFLFPLAAASAFFLVYPLFLSKIFGYGQYEIGLLFGLIGLISIFVQGFVVRKFDHSVPDMTIIQIGLAATLFSFISLGLIVVFPNFGIPLLAFSTIIIPFGHGLVFPTIKSYISKIGKETGKLMGVADSYISIANAIGPVLGGIIFAYDIALPFGFGAALILVILGIIYSGRSSNN